MTGEAITFDGHRLNDSFYVGSVERGLPGFEPNAIDKPRTGSLVRGVRVGGVDIAVQLVAKPVRGMRARQALSELLAWLDVDGPRWLTLSGDDGLRRLAVPSGAPTVDDYEWNDRVTVTFWQPDPWLYGDERSVTVPSGGTATFTVGGDFRTRPTVTSAVAVRDSSSHQWGLTMNDGTHLRVVVPTGSASSVAIDCDARTCAVGGTTATPTLTSDWLVLEPGVHAVTNDVGTGTSVITWTERWHR